MSKKRVNISVDPDIHEQAKEIGLNVSGVAEKASGGTFRLSKMQMRKNQTQIALQRSKMEMPSPNLGTITITINRAQSRKS